MTSEQVFKCFSAEAGSWPWPDSVVYFGGSDSDVCASLASVVPGLRVLPLSEKAAVDICGKVQQPQTLVLIEDQWAERGTSQRLLAALRDRVGSRLVLWSGCLALSDALALGFRRYPATQSMFLYDQFDYKRRPDWFNADHFANPEQWDSFH